MPSYSWLHTATVDYSKTPSKLHVLQLLGVPYEQATMDEARELALAQGRRIADDLRKSGSVEVAPDSEVVALIGYLQQLGLTHEPPALSKAAEVK